MKPRAAWPALLALALVACGRDAPVEATVAKPDATVAAEPIPDGDPRIALAAMMPGIQPTDLRDTPVAGIYELAHDGQISYVTADGKYVFSGNLFQVTETGEFPNLTENRRRELRRQMLADLPEKEMIVFGKASAAHTVTVFTDVDCQWCRHLHAQIADYNRLGIRVRYLAFPRSGPATDSWYKAEAVWCAKDRNDALTQAKLGEKVVSASCATAVARQYALGQQVGISGTPGVILPSGELVPGYLPPQDLLQAIEQGTAANSAAEDSGAG